MANYNIVEQYRYSNEHLDSISIIYSSSDYKNSKEFYNQFILDLYNFFCFAKTNNNILSFINSDYFNNKTCYKFIPAIYHDLIDERFYKYILYCNLNQFDSHINLDDFKSYLNNNMFDIYILANL